MPVPPSEGKPPAPGRLVLLGTGHVFQLEETVRGAIRHYRPDYVGLELDKARFDGLMARERGEKPTAEAGFVHRRLQRFQEGVAAMYGTQAGKEMVAGVRGARDVGARLLLLDGPVDKLLRQVVREMTWREYLRFGGQLGRGLSLGAWNAVRRKKGDAHADVEAEIARYQDDPEKTMRDMAKSFPTIHRILIRERDERMADLLRKAVAGGQSAVAVLGDGHLVGMLPLLADLDPVVHRLRDVRAGAVPHAPGMPVARGTPASVSFSVRSAGLPSPPAGAPPGTLPGPGAPSPGAPPQGL